MYQVAVLPPAAALGPVEEFRRLHDPAFHRIAAHVPLVPPFRKEHLEDLDRFDRFEAGPVFRVAFGPPEVREEGVYLPVTEGLDEMLALRDALGRALLDPLEVPRAVPPALLLGHVGGQAERELVRRAVASGPLPEPFDVSSLTLLLEDERALWHPVRHRVLSVRRDG